LTTSTDDTPEAGSGKVAYIANPLAEQLYQQLKQDIFNFRLFPGDRFSETDIAQH